MSSVDRDRVTRLLGGPETVWLVERIRKRVAAGRALTHTVTRTAATPAERDAVARLLGRRPREGTSVSVPLDELARTLARAGIAPDLRTAVEVVVGPIDNAAAVAAADEARWQRVIEDARHWASSRGLDPWLDDLAASGLLRRQAAGDPDTGARLLDGVRAVVARLPAAGIPRSELAGDALGNGHGLDDGQPVVPLVIRAATRLAGVPGPSEETTPGQWRREVWAGVGVLVGELSSPVLSVGLAGDDRTSLGRVLRTWREAGEPVHLTVRQLARHAQAFGERGQPVWVCENPTVVARASDTLGSRCPPVICTNGNPTTAATVLLARLSSAGADLAYHGDFDWPGIRIANGIIRRFGARPWRMSADDYLAAANQSSRPLRGPSVAADWDPELEASMIAKGVRVEEELVLTALLSDLDTF